MKRLDLVEPSAAADRSEPPLAAGYTARETISPPRRATTSPSPSGCQASLVSGTLATRVITCDWMSDEISNPFAQN